MSVVIETTLGDLTVDLYLLERPRACLNFLKLCKIKFYNYSLFHTISKGFVAQTGDPTGTRSAGESIYGVIEGSTKRYFEAENEPRIKHTRPGLISFVGGENKIVGSQFFLTLGEDLTYLDDKHCVFGEVVEGFEVLEAINEVICDNDDRPYQDVRITHTVVLDDPFADPQGIRIPSRSPSPSAERLAGGRIAPDEEIDETSGRSAKEVAEMQAEREAKARATILEMVGDIPDAEMAPPENVLFVCKLNPVTTDDDLEIIFSRFGKIKSCEVIRDRKTGDSLQYAFIEFEEQKSCEDAYFKMGNVLIDDRRIHVDFSQSVSKVKWLGKGRGVAHFDEKGNQKRTDSNNDLGKGNYKRKNGFRESNMDRKERKHSSPSGKRSRSPINRNHRRSNSPRRIRQRSRSLNAIRKSNRSPPRNRRYESPEYRKRRSRSPIRDKRRRSPIRSRYSKSPDRSGNRPYNRQARSPIPISHKYSPKRSRTPRRDRSVENNRKKVSPKASSRKLSRDRSQSRENKRANREEPSKNTKKNDSYNSKNKETSDRFKVQSSTKNNRDHGSNSQQEYIHIRASRDANEKTDRTGTFLKKSQTSDDDRAKKSSKKKVQSANDSSSSEDSSEEEKIKHKTKKRKIVKIKKTKKVKKKKYSSSGSSSSSDSSSSSNSTSESDEYSKSKKKKSKKKRTKK